MGLLDLIKGYVPQKPKELPHIVFVDNYRYSQPFQIRLNLGPLSLDEGLHLLDFFERHLREHTDRKSKTLQGPFREYEVGEPGGLSVKITTNMSNVTIENARTISSEEILDPQQSLQRILWSYSKEFEGKRFTPVKEDEAAYAEFYLSGDLRRKGRADRMKRGAPARKLIEEAVENKLAVEFIYAGKRNESQKPHWVNLRDSNEAGFRGNKAHGVRRFSWSKVLSARLMDNPEERLPDELVLMLDFSTDPETPPVRLTLTKLLSEDRILGLDPTVKSE